VRGAGVRGAGGAGGDREGGDGDTAETESAVESRVASPTPDTLASRGSAEG